MRGPCERGRILFSRLSTVIQGEFAIGKFEGSINIDVDIEMISINKNNGATGIVNVAITTCLRFNDDHDHRIDVCMYTYIR